MSRKVNVTLYYELFLNDEDEAAYKAVDKDCDPDLILFWSKLCRERGVIVGCNDVKLPPMTNADRIRSMTDEELAIWLADPGKTKDMFPDVPCYIQPSYVHWFVWLREETKDD